MQRSDDYGTQRDGDMTSQASQPSQATDLRPPRLWLHSQVPVRWSLCFINIATLVPSPSTGGQFPATSETRYVPGPYTIDGA